MYDCIGTPEWEAVWNVSHVSLQTRAGTGSTLVHFYPPTICSPLSLSSHHHVLPKHLKPRSVLSLSSPPPPSCLPFQPLPQLPPHRPPLRMTFVTSLPLGHLLPRRIQCASASSRLTLHNTWVSESDHGRPHQSHHHQPPCK